MQGRGWLRTGVEKHCTNGLQLNNSEVNAIPRLSLSVSTPTFSTFSLSQNWVYFCLSLYLSPAINWRPFKGVPSFLKNCVLHNADCIIRNVAEKLVINCTDIYLLTFGIAALWSMLFY